MLQSKLTRLEGYLTNAYYEAKHWLDEKMLEMCRFESSVLISDDWVNEVSFETRKVGQQITRWSCFPSALEVVNYINLGVDGIRQDKLKEKDFPWQKKGGETRWFMPYNRKSLKHTLDTMGVVATEIIKDDEITPANVLETATKHGANGYILCFNKFSLPEVKPKHEVNHTCAIYEISRDPKEKVKLAVPAYNKEFSRNEKTIHTYKNWAEIKKRKPTYVVFISIKNNEKETTKASVLNKFKTWWL